MITAPEAACATVGSTPSMARPSYSASSDVSRWLIELDEPSSWLITIGSATSPPTLMVSLPRLPMMRVITPTGVLRT